MYSLTDFVTVVDHVLCTRSSEKRARARRSASARVGPDIQRHAGARGIHFPSRTSRCTRTRTRTPVHAAAVSTGAVQDSAERICEILWESERDHLARKVASKP